MKNLFKILCVGIVLVTITGCKNDNTPSNGEEKVISFNDESLNVTVDELYKELKTRYAANYLIQKMDEDILNKEYETDNDAINYADNQLKIYKMYYGNDESQLLEALQSAGYRTIDEYKEVLIASYKRSLAADNYAETLIKDSDIESYYKDKVYGDVTISHILVKPDSSEFSTEEEKDEANKKAEDKIKEIYEKLDGGTSFEEVAKEYSEDTATSSNGGLLGTFNKGEMTDKYNEEFENAVLKLEKGKYTAKTIESSYGYHIIYKNDQKEKPELKTVKQMIIEKLIEEKKKEDTKIEYKAMIELREKYGLKINDDEIKSQYDNAVNNWLYSEE